MADEQPQKPATPAPASGKGAGQPAAKPAAGAKPAAKPAPKPGARPAGKAAAKAPAKPKDPLIDNGDGTITDPNTGLMWKKEDAWLDMHQFYTIARANEYIDKLNKEKFAGYDDWRLPTKAEAATLVDKTKECVDKNGTKFHLDPVFAAGRACNTWIAESSPEKVVRFDFKIGAEMVYPPSELWASIYAVRTAGEPKPAEAAAPAAAKPAPAKPAPAK